VTRESRFHYRGQDHHRLEHVFLARTQDSTPTVPLKPTDNEKAGLIERRWWTAEELACCPDKLLPTALPNLLTNIITGCAPSHPLQLTD
jgi:hypothetical protein